MYSFAVLLRKKESKRFVWMVGKSRNTLNFLVDLNFRSNHNVFDGNKSVSLIESQSAFTSRTWAFFKLSLNNTTRIPSVYLSVSLLIFLCTCNALFLSSIHLNTLLPPYSLSHPSHTLVVLCLLLMVIHLNYASLIVR